MKNQVNVWEAMSFKNYKTHSPGYQNERYGSTQGGGGGRVRVTTIANPHHTQAKPKDAKIYAWVTCIDGKFFTYGGKTNNDLHQRFSSPLGVLGWSTKKRLTKAGLDWYPAPLSSDILCIKASSKNPSGENEQEVINALWEAEEYVSRKYGRKNLMFNLNTRAEHRTRKYDERTFNECVKVFDKWFSKQYPIAALRSKARIAKSKALSRKPINVKTSMV